MTRRTAEDGDGEIGEVRIVEDFLPPPGQLALRDDAVKVTPATSSSSSVRPNLAAYPTST
jgi:hypothetical protein